MIYAETGLDEPPICDEGELAWIPVYDLQELPMWEGDKAFLKELLKGTKDISFRLQYEGEKCTILGV